jgi:hypothetical protein
MEDKEDEEASEGEAKDKGEVARVKVSNLQHPRVEALQGNT